MPARLSNGLFISEFLADNAGGSAFDTDGDGRANKADEFVEIQGKTNAAVSLDGIELWTAKRGLLYEFGSGDSVAAGETATVIGQHSGGAPAGFYDAGLPDNNSNAGLLEDGEASKFDTIYLVDTNTGEYIALSYGENAQSQPLPPGFPGTTLAGTETIASGAPNGVPVSRDADGDLVEGGTPDPGTPGPVCFAAGTRIASVAGDIAVEDLCVGDDILTQDNGPQRIRWIGRQVLGAGDLARNPRLRPICIRAGALGLSTPQTDLTVSPQHRVLVRSRIAMRLFGVAEVFVPAVRLVALDGIERAAPGTGVEYFHILLDRHEVIIANGAPAESLHLGRMALMSLDDGARAEIAALFPGQLAGRSTGALARMVPAPAEARTLVARHAKNSQPLLQLDQDALDARALRQPV